MKKKKETNNLNIEKSWSFDSAQTITVFGKKYNIHAALMQAESLEVKELNIDDLYISYAGFGIDTLRDFIEHVKSVNDADLNYPILMNEDGYIIDGRHRLAKAIITGEKTIKCKRFISDPSACYEWV